MLPQAYQEMAAVQSQHWWFCARRDIIREVVAGLGLPDPPNILEIGCGTGGNLAMLSKLGRVSAVEMDEFARSYAESLSGLRIADGRLPDDIPFPEGSFDLVCLFDVLEHVEADVPALAKIGKMVTGTGKILLTVPAYQWLWSRHDEELYHFRRYTAEELRNKATQVGLTVERISYFNTLLFPLVALTRVYDHLRKAAKATGTQVPARQVNELLRKIFASEALILNRINMPFGASLLAILRPGS